MIVNTHYSYCSGGGVPGERATIVVTAPTGSTVTATLGSTTLRASEVSGTWTFNVREFGVWTINASKDSESTSTTVNVTEDTTYNVTLAYNVTITISGSNRKLGTSNQGVAVYCWLINIPNIGSVNSAGVYSVPRGATITVAVGAISPSNYGEITFNGQRKVRAAGVSVATYVGTFAFEATDNATCACELNSKSKSGIVNITM